MTLDQEIEDILTDWFGSDAEHLPGAVASFKSLIGELLATLEATLGERTAALNTAEAEVQELIASIGEHVTVRSEYMARATAAEALLREEAGDLGKRVIDRIRSLRAWQSAEFEKPFAVTR